MAQESTAARSSAIGRAQLLRGSHLTEDEVIERISSVTMDDIAAVLPTLTNTEDISVAAVGRIAKSEKELRSIFGIDRKDGSK